MIELWIARDKDNELSLYNGDKPKRIRDDYFIPEPPGKGNYCNIDSSLFPEVTWENSPRKVKIELL